jgi:hypothetical protein
MNLIDAEIGIENHGNERIGKYIFKDLKVEFERILIIYE